MIDRRAFERFLRGEISPEDFAREVSAHLESPEGRRKMAEMEARRLKSGKAGRELLFSLIRKAQDEGRDVSYAFFREGGLDSVLVTLDGSTLGFPDYMPPEVVAGHFRDLVARAASRSAQSGNGGTA